MSYKDMLKQKQEEMLGQKLEFPLIKVQIDQVEGKFRIGGTRNEEGEWEGAEYVEELRIVVFERYGEYFYFNPDTEKVEKRSTIERNASECKELISRVSIAELKEAGYQFTYLSHLIGIKVNANPVPVDLVLKGIGVKSFIDFLTKEKDYWRKRLLYVLKVRLEKGKKGAVKFFYPVFEIQEVSEEEAKIVLENVDKVLEEFEEFRKAYNNRSRKKETEDVIEEEIADDLSEDVIDF